MLNYNTILNKYGKNISNIQLENKYMGVCELLSTLFEVFKNI